MLRVERVDRKSFFEGMTPGWIAGVVTYVVAVLGLFYLSRLTDRDLAPCLLRQWTGLPCPLCGGTRTAMSLASGDLAAALVRNPLVAIGLPLAGVWIALRVGGGISVKTSLPRPLLVSLLVALVVVNWAWVIHSS